MKPNIIIFSCRKFEVLHQHLYIDIEGLRINCRLLNQFILEDELIDSPQKSGLIPEDIQSHSITIKPDFPIRVDPHEIEFFS